MCVIYSSERKLNVPRFSSLFFNVITDFKMKQWNTRSCVYCVDSLCFFVFFFINKISYRVIMYLSYSVTPFDTASQLFNLLRLKGSVGVPQKTLLGPFDSFVWNTLLLCWHQKFDTFLHRRIISHRGKFKPSLRPIGLSVSRMGQCSGADLVVWGKDCRPACLIGPYVSVFQAGVLVIIQVSRRLLRVTAQAIRIAWLSL